MGEGKRARAALAEWRRGLSPQECLVATVSENCYEVIVRGLGLVGGCYRISFFLSAFFARQHQIRVEPIVGFINDGESDVMASHAWLEFNGKKIDLTLTMTEFPDKQPPGPLLILDRQFKPGRAVYTYHRVRGEAAMLELKRTMEVPRYRGFALAKEAEHERMLELAAHPAMIHEYLDGAPDGLGYEDLACRLNW